MKNQNKMFILGMTYISLMIVIGVNFVSQSKAYITDVLYIKPIEIIKVVEVEKQLPVEIPVKEYIKIEIEKAGLNWEEVECLIIHESNWENTCNANKNLSTDCGIWRINSVHKDTITFADRLDYKRATRWSISKRLHDGNWSAWYGYINNCK